MVIALINAPYVMNAANIRLHHLCGDGGAPLMSGALINVLLLWADDVGLAPVGAEPVVAATLRDLRSASKAAAAQRLPLSTALQSLDRQQQQQQLLAMAAASVVCASAFEPESAMRCCRLPPTLSHFEYRWTERQLQGDAAGAPQL